MPTVVVGGAHPTATERHALLTEQITKTRKSENTNQAYPSNRTRAPPLRKRIHDFRFVLSLFRVFVILAILRILALRPA
jgi:hypothetical protein